jgi:hypothetical protein
MEGLNKKATRLISVSIVAFLLLNFPLLSTVSNTHLLLGLPVLYVYVFFVWALLISATFLISQNQSKK